MYFCRTTRECNGMVLLVKFKVCSKGPAQCLHRFVGYLIGPHLQDPTACYTHVLILWPIPKTQTLRALALAVWRVHALEPIWVKALASMSSNAQSGGRHRLWQAAGPFLRQRRSSLPLPAVLGMAACVGR